MVQAPRGPAHPARLRLVSIARVSTQGQSDNTSPETQHSRCKTWADKNNAVIVERLTEVESGAAILSRAFNPAGVIFDALRRIERGDVDGVVLDVPDRLGRGKIQSQIELLIQLAGGQLFYAGGFTDELARLADQLASESERQKIQRRTIGGKRQRVADGYVIRTWQPPYGYRFARAGASAGAPAADAHSTRRPVYTLRPVKDELLVWLVGYHWLMGKTGEDGRSPYEHILVERGIAAQLCPITGGPASGSGVSLHEVARRFTAMGIPRPALRPNILPASPAATAAWPSQTVRNMYRNPVYAGQYRFGYRVRRHVDTAQGRRPRLQYTRAENDPDLRTAKVPGVITMKAWKRLQRLLSSRRDQFTRQPIHEYLLRGMVRCVSCGLIMRSLPSQSGTGTWTLYYRCRAEHLPRAQQCRARWLPDKHTGAVVWGVVWEWLQAPENYNRPELNAPGPDTSAETATIGSLTRARDTMNKRLERLGRELAEMVRLARASTNDRTRAEVARQESEINAQMDAVQAGIASVESKIEQARAAAKTAAAAVSLADRIRAEHADLRARNIGGVPHAPFAVRRQVLEDIQLSAVWDSEAGTLTLSSLIGRRVLTLKAGKRVRFEL